MSVFELRFLLFTLWIVAQKWVLYTWLCWRQWAWPQCCSWRIRCQLIPWCCCWSPTLTTSMLKIVLMRLLLMMAALLLVSMLLTFPMLIYRFFELDPDDVDSVDEKSASKMHAAHIGANHWPKLLLPLEVSPDYLKVAWWKRRCSELLVGLNMLTNTMMLTIPCCQRRRPCCEKLVVNDLIKHDADEVVTRCWVHLLDVHVSLPLPMLILHLVDITPLRWSIENIELPRCCWNLSSLCDYRFLVVEVVVENILLVLVVL